MEISVMFKCCLDDALDEGICFWIHKWGGFIPVRGLCTFWPLLRWALLINDQSFSSLSDYERPQRCLSPALKLDPSFTTRAARWHFSLRLLEALEWLWMSERESLRSASLQMPVGSMLSLFSVSSWLSCPDMTITSDFDLGRTWLSQQTGRHLGGSQISVIATRWMNFSLC